VRLLRNSQAGPPPARPAAHHPAEVRATARSRRAAVARLKQDADAVTVARLVRRFADLRRACSVSTKTRCGAPITTLEGWLKDAKRSGVAAVTTFAAGLQRDGAAVKAALTSTWSSGQTEEQVGKLKMLKRQTFGRSSFDILRRRVLLVA
jgi:hypothetical protein